MKGQRKDYCFHCIIYCYRYTKGKQQEPAPPTGDSNRSSAELNGRSSSSFSSDDLSISAESKLNRRYVSQNKTLPNDLADSKLNTRYNESKTNGHINGDLSNGDIHPYVKNTYQLAGSNSHLEHTAKDHILRQKISSKVASNSSDFGSVKSTADMDQWVDSLFHQVLNGNLDDLTDAKLLEQKMKGGGELNQVCLFIYLFICNLYLNYILGHLIMYVE